VEYPTSEAPAFFNSPIEHGQAYGGVRPASTRSGRRKESSGLPAAGLGVLAHNTVSHGIRGAGGVGGSGGVLAGGFTGTVVESLVLRLTDPPLHGARPKPFSVTPLFLKGRPVVDLAVVGPGASWSFGWALRGRG